MEGASPPAHPTMSVGRATMAMLGNTQGKRTGVVVDARKPKLVVHSQPDGDVDDDEPEDDDMIDHYLSTAAQPPVTQEDQQQQKARGHPKTPPTSILKNKSNHKNKPRFSMPGVVDDDNKMKDYDEAEPGKSSKYMGKVVTSKGKIDFSPGDVSRASTAFTTPGSRREATTPKSTARSQMQGTPMQDTPQEQEEEGEDGDEEMVDSPLLRDQSGDGSEEEDDDEMEVARVSPQRTPHAQERMTKSPAVQPVTMTEDPMEQEEDDGDDDMIPPPPPEEHSESDVVDQQPSVAVAATSRAKAEDDVDDDDDDDRRNDFPLDNDDFDDDDKEGSGFQVAGTPGVQSESDDDEQERIVDKKRRVKESLEARRRKEKETESKKPKSKAGARKLKATKPQQKKARFVSPQGIQAGDRIFDAIPVDRYKHSPEDKTLRRSNRARCPPLQYWKSERIIYGPNDDPEVMGLMPVPVSVLTAQPTPYKKINRQTKRPRSAREDDDHDDESEPEEDRNPPFDSTKLRKKFEILDGETAFVWDETIDDGREMKIVSYYDDRLLTDLPLGSRKKSEGKVVGQVSHGFNGLADNSRTMGGYIAGTLKLTRKAIKDAESVGNCSQIFTVCCCQPGSLELAISHPEDQPGTMDPEKASRFLLSPNDLFRIPPDNTYRLQNHSTTTDCVLSWSMIRPGDEV